jgi:putative copper resistance protein D
MAVLVILVFGIFEWSVRTDRLTAAWARSGFPLLCALGGTLLLVHSHSLSDVKVRYLIEISHIPMGVLGISAGWARWLEVRGEGHYARLAGWIWPICFILIALLLLNYRES